MCENPVLLGLQNMVGRIMTIVEKLVTRMEALENHVFSHSGNIKSPQPPFVKGGQKGIPNRRTSDVKPKSKSKARTVLRLVKPAKEVTHE